MNHLRHQKYKNNKQLNNTRLSKAQNCPLELEKSFKQNLINLDKFGKKELSKNTTLAKNIWYDWYDLHS